MKFPVLGMVLMLVLGQYMVLEFSSRLAQSLAGVVTLSNEKQIASASTITASVFCHQPTQATWQCP